MIDIDFLKGKAIKKFKDHNLAFSITGLPSGTRSSKLGRSSKFIMMPTSMLMLSLLAILFFAEAF